MSYLDAICKECGARMGDHIIGGPASFHPNPVKETNLELRIRRLRAAVNGEDFEFEINRGSPFDDCKALLQAYDDIQKQLGKISAVREAWQAELSKHIEAAKEAKQYDDGHEYDLHCEAIRVYKNAMATLCVP